MEYGFIKRDYGTTGMFEMSSFNRTGLVSHGVSTRLGGEGKIPYNSLNLAFHVGDEQQTVINNRITVCRLLGTEPGQMVTARQVHGTNIRVVDSRHAGAGAFSYDSALPDTDGLVTNEPGILLATFYADCVPVFILDPVARVIATVHAGWKGTVSGIGAEAVRKMSLTFGCKPADCLIGIGPSIGVCCYEVNETVIGQLRERYNWWQEVLSMCGPGKAMLDLRKANRNILIDAGIKAHNVEIAQICTKCNQDILFSHRGSRGITGRMGAFIMLKSDLTSEEENDFYE